MYYRRVELNAKGNTDEPVDLAAAHPLHWNTDSLPECGLVAAPAVDDVIKAAQAVMAWWAEPWSQEGMFQAVVAQVRKALDALPQPGGPA